MTSDLKRRVRALAVYIVGPRLDWEFQVLRLRGNLLCEVSDYLRTPQTDASGGFATVAEYDAWHAASLAQMYAYRWPAQVQEPAAGLGDLFHEGDV